MIIEPRPEPPTPEEIADRLLDAPRDWLNTTTGKRYNLEEVTRISQAEQDTQGIWFIREQSTTPTPVKPLDRTLIIEAVIEARKNHVRIY